MEEVEPRPFYWAALGYCERHGLGSPDDIEQVRQAIAASELSARMQPATDLLMENHPSRYSPNGELPPAYLALQREVAGLRAQLAEELGLSRGADC
jgi:hypothetical protein